MSFACSARSSWPQGHVGIVIAPSIDTGPFGWPARPGRRIGDRHRGPAAAGSIGVSLLNTIFASAVASYITVHAASARLIGRPALTGLALAHGYDTAFWWSAAIFASGALIGGALLRSGPLYRKDSQAQPDARVLTAKTKAGPGLPA